MLPRSRTLAAHLFRHWRKMAGGLACLLCSTLLGLALPVILRRVVDLLAAAPRADLRRVGELCLLLAGLAGAGGLARIGSRILIFHAGRDLERDVRREAFARLLALDPAFYRRTPTGDLMSRLTSDLGNVRAMVAMSLLGLVGTAITIGSALVLMLRVDVRLAVLALLPTPVMMAVVQLCSRALFRRSRAVQEEIASLSQAVQEDLAGMAVIKSYALEEARARTFARRNDRYIGRNMDLARVQAHMNPLIALLVSPGALIVLLYGGRLVARGAITLGALLEMLTLVGMLAWPTLTLGWVVSLWQRGRASWARLRDILAAEPAIFGGAATFCAPAPGRGARIEVRGLTVRRDGRTVLDDVSFAVPAGTTCAIVGRTGAGKTSLVEALPRLVEVPPGTVLFDGQDVTALPLGPLRAAIGYAPQEAFLFSATIRENIEFGLRDRGSSRAGPPEPKKRSREQRAVGGGSSQLCCDEGGRERPPLLIDATEAAGLAPDLASFPDGLETVVGERGITLSGGQRQRVALARALVSDPAVLILDDSLSSVDAQTERAILDRLGAYLRGRTSLLISHRVAAVRHADQILVMDAGRVAERGTHEELVARGGIYASLYRQQLAEEELGALATADDGAPEAVAR